MRRLIVGLFGLTFCITAFAHTIEWYVDDTLYHTTTCASGDNITPPTPPAKTGYHFDSWTRLPAGYTELEYIESSGTQYIDTGYTWISPNHKVVVKISDVASGVNQWLWGSYTDDVNIRPGVIGITSANKLSVGVGNVGTASNTYTIDIPTTPTTLTLEVKDDNTFSLLGGSITYTNVSVSGTFITGIPEYIFAGNQLGADSYNSRYKLYNLQMYDNGTLKRNFIPAKNSSGVVGMYDTVSGQFFTNAGTGVFIAGPVAQ